MIKSALIFTWRGRIDRKMKFVCTSVFWSVVFTGFILLLTVYKLTDYQDAKQSIAKFTAKQFQDKFPTASTDLETGGSDIPLWEQRLDFDQLKISNETGNPPGCYLVPNYIHFVHFGGTPLKYHYMICVLAAFKNQKPEKIFFHYDDNTTFTGKYWEVLLQTSGFKEVMVQHKIDQPSQIYGQPLSTGWRKWHASDITRIQMVMKYGGVFLDNDCYLIKSIDDYRRFEISINWDEGQFLGSQVIIAHKDARFLKKWLECYKVYDKDKWYYNAGERPTVEVLYKQPELIHRVKVLFGADNKFIHNIFQQQWSGWKDLYIVHLLIGHQYLIKSINDKAVFPVEFNETNIAYYPVTFRDMAYDVYDIANIKWPKAKYS